MAIGDRKTIDCTPTWSALLPTLLSVLEEARKPENVENIKKELGRMADIADRYVALFRVHNSGWNTVGILKKLLEELKYVMDEHNYPSWLKDVEDVLQSLDPKLIATGKDSI